MARALEHPIFKQKVIKLKTVYSRKKSTEIAPDVDN